MWINEVTLCREPVSTGRMQTGKPLRFVKGQLSLVPLVGRKMSDAARLGSKSILRCNKLTLVDKRAGDKKKTLMCLINMCHTLTLVSGNRALNLW